MKSKLVGVNKLKKEVMLMKKLYLLLVMFACLIPVNSFGGTFTLGEQDFVDGYVVSGVSEVSNAGVGEPAPFDTFYGSDPYGPNFDCSFTFSFAPASVLSAMLTFGLIDGDGNEVGNQLALFSLDGMDLTAFMSPLIENTLHVTASVVDFELPAAALNLLADGSATFRLVLQGPSMIGQLPYNGAALDFARLDTVEASSIPEPATLLLLGIGLVGLAGVRRKLIK